MRSLKLPPSVKRWALSLVPVVLLLAASVGAAQVSRASLTANARSLHMLTHGPFLESSTPTTALIWLRFSGPVAVQVRYGMRTDLHDAVDTPPLLLRAEEDFTGFVRVEGLQPGGLYYYSLVVDGEEVPFARPFTLQTAPAAGTQFTVVAGGNADDKVQLAWAAMRKLKPAFFISTGNLVQMGPVRTLEDARYPHRALMANEQFRAFAAEAPVLPLLSSGELGERSDWNRTLRAFAEHWALPGSAAGQGTWRRLGYGEVDFFMLDTVMPATEHSLLGDDQWAWFEQGFRESRAAFKVLVSAVPFHTWSAVSPADWSRLTALLGEGDSARGVMLLAGGERRTEVWQVEAGPGAQRLYELVPGRLAVGGEASAGERCGRPAPDRLFCSDRYSAFAALTFDTTPGKLVANLRLLDERGDELYGLALQGDRSAEMALLPPGLTPGTLSGLQYEPSTDTFWTHMDSGPGTRGWVLRLFQLRLHHGQLEVLSTVTLTDEHGDIVTGADFDPEAIALAPDGTFWMTDEYGPWMVQVSREGRILRRIDPPERYRRRVSGQGLEGVAVSLDGTTVYTVLQTPLTTERDFTRTSLLAYHVPTGTFREYPYVLDDLSKFGYANPAKIFIGANGLDTLPTGELVALERDNVSGADARVKRIYRLIVPEEPGRPITKTLLLDLLSMNYPYEKLEGLTVVGPGTLAIINDNDGNPENQTAVWLLHY